MVSMQDIAKEVKATAEIIDTVSKILADASRSAVIEVNNATSRTLRRLRSAHAHGVFAKLPADSIGPFQSDVFGSKSSEGSIATGTTGLIVYGLDDEGTALKISWVVPFIGGNEARAEVTGPNAGFYVCRGEISGGNKKVAARFAIGENAALSPRVSDWRTCGECKTLFFALDAGRCPGNVTRGQRPPIVIGEDGQLLNEPRYGAHQAAGLVFRLPFGVPGPNRESGWRKCARCKALFFDGFEDKKGACPKWSAPRPGHVAEAGGHDFLLPFDMPLRPGQQNDWRFCDRCFVLFYWPHNADGNCAAGGRHHPHPFNYVLDHL
ncbi:hypothetical protein AB0B56_21645 [Streptosporangium canum]|uniref:hypothetical protein n=1 Tax=Streptosporangium canum TaxID=324952 RepID=UPI00342070F5